MDIKVKDIIKVCNAKLLCGDENIICESFSKDTRTIQENDVYIGIKGENFDGNTLYSDAFEKGASVCILQGIEISEDDVLKYKNKAIILVDDTIKALQEIAMYKRSLYNIPVIAVTGSVGKTSTKDIIASVVGTEFNVLKTQGNLNNHIGLPMTILELRNHNALVVEMGMNNLGEISVLSKIAKPNVAVITNVGTSHIGNLGSRENILKAKLEILDGLDKDGVLIINNDNDLLNIWNKSKGILQKVYTYGIDNESDIMGNNIVLNSDNSKFSAKFSNEEILEDIVVPVGGLHFVYNALCAIAVGKILNISYEKIIYGIQKFELTKSRMEIINLKNKVTLINDCYNANFDSMKAAIEYLASTKGSRKIAVLGDMLELGEFSNDLHKKVGEELVRNKIDLVVTVGEMSKVIYNFVRDNGVDAFWFEDNMSAVDKILNLLEEGDFVLVKASNGMRFREIVGGILDRF